MNETHTNTLNGGLHCQTCGKEHADLEAANEHTTVFENVPNAAVLL